MEVKARALSLGAGVQSSVLALLASREDPRLAVLGYSKPDIAIFADTGYEPRAVYEHLNWLEQQLTFPVHRVQASSLREDFELAVNSRGDNFITVPLNLEGGGKLVRQCTTHYKIEPIIRQLRAFMGKTKRPMPKDWRAEQWIGISYDETIRMKPSRDWWIINRWPLVDLKMRRSDCRDWFETEYPSRTLPRSACVICPYRTIQEWKDLREQSPEDWAEAVAVDERIRDEGHPIKEKVGKSAFIHRSLMPLLEAVENASQKDQLQPELFGEECEGMCGV